MRRYWWLLGVIALLSGRAQAAGWTDCTSGLNASPVKDGRCAKWSETGTSDSGVLTVATGARCDDTGNTNITVYRALKNGTKLHEWWSLEDGASCGPDATTDDCGTTELPPGYYVFVPETPDAGTAQAQCIGDYASPAQ